MIEGEEEVGSDNLGTFVKENKEKLKCDTILISDTGIIANDTPSITTGLKGLSYLEVEVTGPNRDLHSGLYGGAVANPINILCEMIAKMKDENNHIIIPGFYDNVLRTFSGRKSDIARAPFSLDRYKSALDLSDIHGEEGYSTMERTGIRPTLDVNGIWGGIREKVLKQSFLLKLLQRFQCVLFPTNQMKRLLRNSQSSLKALLQNQ